MTSLGFTLRLLPRSLERRVLTSNAMTNTAHEFLHHGIWYHGDHVDPILTGNRDHPLHYLTSVFGTIQVGRTYADQNVIGKFNCAHLRVDWAKADRFPLRAVFEGSDLGFLYPLLFDHATEQLTVDLVDRNLGADVFYLDQLSVLPEYRGRRLAGAFADRLAFLRFRQFAVMVVRAAPEPPEDIDEGDTWAESVYAQPFVASGEAARRKLRAYWASFGFRPLGSSEFMVRDCTSLVPPPVAVDPVQRLEAHRG
jgi:hypothetical protein